MSPVYSYVVIVVCRTSTAGKYTRHTVCAAALCVPILLQRGAWRVHRTLLRHYTLVHSLPASVSTFPHTFFFFFHFPQKRFVCLLCLLSNFDLTRADERNKKDEKTSMRLAKRTTHTHILRKHFIFEQFSRHRKIQWFRSKKMYAIIMSPFNC